MHILKTECPNTVLSCTSSRLGVLICCRAYPQVLKVVSSGTAVGLSLTSNVLELLTDVVKLAYNMSKASYLHAQCNNTCI